MFGIDDRVLFFFIFIFFGNNNNTHLFAWVIDLFIFFFRINIDINIESLPKLIVEYNLQIELYQNIKKLVKKNKFSRKPFCYGDYFIKIMITKKNFFLNSIQFIFLF